MMACSILCYQVISVYSDALAQLSAQQSNGQPCSPTIGDVYGAVQKLLDPACSMNLTIEVYALLMCSLDQVSWYVDPSCVCASLLQQFTQQCVSFESNLVAINKGLIGTYSI